MAYPRQTRTQVEIAIACGMSVREAVEAFGVSKTTINCWLNAKRKQAQLQACQNWHAANPEKARECHRRWYYGNIDLARGIARDCMKEWRINNPEAAKIKDRQSHKRQYAKSPEYYAEKARRRQLKRQSFPMTKIEKKMCANYYKLARELTEQTGVAHEVDHIWPISKGGPHLPWNLQVLTAEQNRKKGNKI